MSSGRSSAAALEPWSLRRSVTTCAWLPRMSMTVIFAGAARRAALRSASSVPIPAASRSARSCSARTSSAVLYSRRSRLSSLRRFHISFSLVSFSRLARAFSAATFSAALFVFRPRSPAPVPASSSSSSEPSLLLSRPASLKPLKPMPMFLGLIWVSIGAAIPLPSLPRPRPFLYPIFSSSFMPMPLVCFSNSPSFGSGFAFSHGRVGSPPPRSRRRSMSSSFFLSRASSASLRRCAAFCMTLCVCRSNRWERYGESEAFKRGGSNDKFQTTDFKRQTTTRASNEDAMSRYPITRWRALHLASRRAGTRAGVACAVAG